ncbi:uncharacterized protein CIMG_01338 [Coccidioides immitis RS]|uniref:Uncharacterized protein n=1 Tax=Coccidioides immitis (strain RS) TaxID=246410 RepID=A0A0E1RZQ2_COCIM|nr:uncharacterized protein CIMG_01338 [Coccidioides immitis RS]EAS35984.2 hypothetical protein CIMG_01338 [Coccidioides immitis RS]
MGWISNLQQYPRKNNRLPYSLNGYKESVSHEETIVTSPIPISQISILQLLHTLISHIPYGIARYGLPLGGYYKDS